ncbi:MAG: hypothetical protein H6741_05570 [Alphaproteobacteria bacterium]|nr:hypothetical protein [Alphaproteobacteria bacterium]
MNIFLVPYTWWRHLQVAALTSGTALMAWWLLLGWIVWQGPFWPIEFDGAIYMGVVGGSVGATSVLAEGSLKRQPIWKRFGRTALAGAISGGFSFTWYWVWTFITVKILFPSSAEIDYGDPSLVSLRYKVGAFAMLGLCTAIGPAVVRQGEALLSHLAAGLAAGFSAAVVWHALGYSPYEIVGDLYMAGGMAALTFGAVFGLLAWGIPDELYAGWLRVLSDSRFGYRIPIDHLDRRPAERFVGHFPRGLDLWLPAEDAVKELHLSIVVDEKQRYAARGLSLDPTLVQRFLERVDIRYDATRPAPLETAITSGDRITLGDPKGASATVEFIMLPREER